MKILRLCAALMSVLLLLCACDRADTADTQAPNIEKETVGVWVTYSEIDAMVNSPAGFGTEFSAALEKMQTVGVNTVYFHTVAFCDAVYPSEIYPERHSGAGDILAIAVEKCAAAGIELHAWINPYRVQTSSSNINTLPDGFVKEWLSDENSESYSNIGFTDSGIYLNPASSAVRNKVLSGVREILNNYAVSGIHFDDYFYPTTDAEFDKASFSAYESSTQTPLTLEEWRRTNVNTLMLGVYGAVKAHNSELMFGISPAADLDRCYNTLYADVEGWIGGGYIDYILPQLYFGFEYPIERFRFENLIIKWLDITENKDVRLIIGLPMYKSGTTSEPDSTEWQADNTIVARQIECVRQYNISGFVYFSYSSLFSENAANAEQLKNIKEVI